MFWQATWLIFPDKYEIDCKGFTVIIPERVFPQPLSEVIVYGNVPLWVGLPVIIPVTGSKVTPPGKVEAGESIILTGTIDEITPWVILYRIGTAKELPIQIVGDAIPETNEIVGVSFIIMVPVAVDWPQIPKDWTV